MNQIFSRPLTYIVLLAFIILGGWISFLPVRIAQNLRAVLQDQTGRSISIGNSGYSLTPQFGIALQNVDVAGTSSLNETVFHADTVFAPISAWQFLTANTSPQTLIADGADIHVAFDGVGHTNVFEGQSPKQTTPIHLQLTNSNFHYFDERSGDQFVLEQISDVIDISGEGEISSSGSAVVNGQFINFDATLASLERAFSDGSPLDLTVDGVASSFSFSGRVATAKRLDLAGQVDISSTDAPRLAKWVGVKVSALANVKNLNLNGGLDSDGPVMLLKDATLKLGDVTGKGEVSFSNAGEHPNMTVALNFENLDLNLFRSQTPAADNWSEKQIDFSELNSLDVQFRLQANALTYRNLRTGAATVEGMLKNRVLDAVVKSQNVASGTGQITLNLDATQLPPNLKLDVSLANVAAKPLLAALSDQNNLSGSLNFESHVTATGNSQTEMISTLSGDATASLDNGAISGADLSTLATQPMDGWNGGQTVNLKGQAQFKVSEGVATFGENQLDGVGVSLHTDGEIDLLRKALDLTTGPDVKVKIQGPWGKPTLTPQ